MARSTQVSSSSGSFARSRALLLLVAVVVASCVGSADTQTLVPQNGGGGAGGGGGGGGSSLPFDGGIDNPDLDSGVIDAGVEDAGTPDAGPTDPCSGVQCGDGSHCVANPVRCVCNPGYVPDGGACLPGDPGVPALRTSAQVCTAYKNGLVTTTNAPFSKTTMTCDPGVLAREGIDDTLNRLNMYRWLVGLGPVSDDATEDDRAQKCALMSAWNPAGSQAHTPSPSATCYTTEGAQGAGSSNIAWGSGSPQAAIEQWLVDNGNETTMGHRRWLLNPPLDPVGMGYYEGGNNYGSAACITVFGGSNPGPRPDWWSLPPPGFSPVDVTQWSWTLHGNIGGGLDAGVVRASDNASLPVTILYLAGSYGAPAVTIQRNGWSPVAGETYQVHITGSGGAIDYDVKPVNCP